VLRWTHSPPSLRLIVLLSSTWSQAASKMFMYVRHRIRGDARLVAVLRLVGFTRLFGALAALGSMGVPDLQLDVYGAHPQQHDVHVCGTRLRSNRTCRDTQINGPHGMRREPGGLGPEGGPLVSVSLFPSSLTPLLTRLQGLCASVTAPQYEKHLECMSNWLRQPMKARTYHFLAD
jgi:hypothetical protein